MMIMSLAKKKKVLGYQHIWNADRMYVVCGNVFFGAIGRLMLESGLVGCQENSTSEGSLGGMTMSLCTKPTPLGNDLRDLVGRNSRVLTSTPLNTFGINRKGNPPI